MGWMDNVGFVRKKLMQNGRENIRTELKKYEKDGRESTQKDGRRNEGNG